MKHALIQRSLAFAAALLFVVLADSPACAQSTVFTYQGLLDDAGAPTSGLHDFRFRLFDAASGGVQIGSTLCVDNVNVTAGVFTVSLDFGQQYATTAQRHLEIEVRRDTGLSCANAAGFVVMAPRQELTATPMSSHANSAFALDAPDGSPTSAVFVDDSGNVGIGTTTPTARLDVRGGAMLVENVGDQADLLWLASERSWVFRQQGTGATTALKLESLGGGGNKNFIVQTDGFMGVGTTSPAAKLDVRGDIRFGSSGQFRAAAGVENLRLLRGTIDGNGSIIAGTGFSSQRISEGFYAITFSTPFASVPTVTASAVQPWAQTMRWATVTDGGWLTASGMRISIHTGSASTTDSDWSFCVIGPR